MGKQSCWRQIALPIDLGEPSSIWKCPFCKSNTVLVVTYQDKTVFLHARKICVKTVWVEE